MQKIISIILTLSLIFSSVAPSYAQLLDNAASSSSYADIDPLGSWANWSENAVMSSSEFPTESEIQELEQELDEFAASLKQTGENESSNLSETELKAQFKQAYLAELDANRLVLEEEFGTPLPRELVQELNVLRKESEINKAWEEYNKNSEAELARIGKLIFELYDKPGKKAAALEYMYTLFPSIAAGMDAADKERGLQIMRGLVNQNAKACREAGTWTEIKAFFGKTADLNDRQTRCEQALAAVQLLPVLGDFSKNSDDVKSAVTLLAEGFDGVSSILLIQIVGGILLEAGRTDALADVMAAALGKGGASYGFLFADYTPDFTSVVNFFAEGGDGFSKGFEYSYYASPAAQNSNQRNAWADLGRVWGQRSPDGHLKRVLDAAVKSADADDVKFKPFVVGVLASGYIYKNRNFTQQLAKNLFLMSKGDLSPYTATYMENLLAVAYHKAGGVDQEYNALAAKYQKVPPLNQENYWTCSYNIDVPAEELPERVVCQWTQPSTAQFKAEQVKIAWNAVAMMIDGLLAVISVGAAAGFLIYKLLAGAGKLAGQGAKWANAAWNLYRKARIVWLRSKLVRMGRKVERAVASGIALAERKVINWVIVKPSKKFHEVLRRLRARVHIPGHAASSGAAHFAVDFVVDEKNKKFFRDLYKIIREKGHGDFDNLADLAVAAKEDAHLRRTIAAYANDLPDAHFQIVKSWRPVSRAKDPVKWREIDSFVRGMRPSFGEQFVELLVKYPSDSNLRKLLGDYVFVEIRNGKLILATERKMGEVVNELGGNVPNFVKEKGLDLSGCSPDLEAEFRVSRITRRGTAQVKSEHIPVADVEAFLQREPNVEFIRLTLPNNQRLTSAADKTLENILKYGKLDSRMFLDLSAQTADDAQRILKSLRESINDFAPQAEQFLSGKLPAGSRYRIRYNYRMVAHEVDGGVRVIPSSNIHMHMEVYVDNYDIVYNFNIPVKLSDTAADNLRRFHENWPNKVPWYNRWAASRYNKGESILMDPSNQSALSHWTRVLLGGIGGGAAVSLVADDEGFYEEGREGVVGETPAPVDSVSSESSAGAAVVFSEMLSED